MIKVLSKMLKITAMSVKVQGTIFQVLLCEISHDAIWYGAPLHCGHVLDRRSLFLFRCYCCVHIVFKYSLELSLWSFFNQKENSV